MSFEGYYQKLCKKGHYTTENLSYNFDENEGYLQCAVCGEKIVWSHLVDITNGSFDDEGNRIDGYIELEKKSRKVCKHCGSILEIKYNIPKKEK